ncbi:MAG: DUF481 domain-containing protein, partial [Planctomycetes bacterium]|nr:DUF481 domain-containing protein [Planctomycetota bacterium]
PAVPPHPQDAGAIQPPPPLPATPPAARAWTTKGRFGAFVSDTHAGGDSSQSPDPTIRGTTNTAHWLLTFDGALDWRGAVESVDQSLIAKYGRAKQSEAPWTTSTDELRYDGVYRRDIDKPLFLYGGWGLQTLFEGPLDPFQAHASTGVGQLFEDLLPIHDKLEWRLGVRAQRTWGKDLPEGSGDYTVGPEAYLRYERQVSKDLRFFVQSEAYDEFRDLGHVTSLTSAGLQAQVSRYITAEINLRAYYEARPRRVSGAGVGYSEWFVRQDALVGLTYSF